MELAFLSLVDSLSKSGRLMSTSAVDGPLQLFVRSSECSISSKVVFGRGALLHVSIRASGYFGGRMAPEMSPSSLPPVDI